MSAAEDALGGHCVSRFIRAVVAVDRQHGGPKRRLWRKIYIGTDEETLKIRAVEVTASSIGATSKCPDAIAARPSQYLGRALWRHLTGCHRKSRVETKMHCLKLPGQRLSARDFDRWVAQIQIRAAILNGFTALGIPKTVAAA